MSDSWSLVAVAAVSRSNRPLVSQLFLPETATAQDELQLQFLVHSSLDVCEERVDALLKRGMFGPQGQKLLGAGLRSGGGGAGSGDVAASGNYSGGGGAGVAAGGAFHSSSTGGVQSTSTMGTAATSLQNYADNQIQQSPFLDRLIQAQRYSSWGYQSSTGIKLIAVTFGGDPPTTEMKFILSTIYEHLSVTMCSPFRVNYDEPINSDAFISSITNLVFRYTVQGQKSTEMQ